MVIHDFNVGRPLIGPNEANAPLPVYANRMLPGTPTFQLLEMVARWKPEVLKDSGGVHCRQHGAGPLDHISRKTLAISVLHRIGRKLALRAYDHEVYVSRYDTQIKGADSLSKKENKWLK